MSQCYFSLQAKFMDLADRGNDAPTAGPYWTPASRAVFGAERRGRKASDSEPLGQLLLARYLRLGPCRQAGSHERALEKGALGWQAPLHQSGTQTSLQEGRSQALSRMLRWDGFREKRRRQEQPRSACPESQALRTTSAGEGGSAASATEEGCSCIQFHSHRAQRGRGIAEGSDLPDAAGRELSPCPHDSAAVLPRGGSRARCVPRPAGDQLGLARGLAARAAWGPRAARPRSGGSRAGMRGRKKPEGRITLSADISPAGCR
ncbi:uncharacterized protein LOC135450318 [Zonotrichia leucophrys gambelii]|uniref:uncharacterized protein LOC135450318 n=1 Tax=Zonotrichia leucophrys gambelii TaxID=257770 RepID=UPI0031403326